MGKAEEEQKKKKVILKDIVGAGRGRTGEEVCRVRLQTSTRTETVPVIYDTSTGESYRRRDGGDRFQPDR